MADPQKVARDGLSKIAGHAVRAPGGALRSVRRFGDRSAPA